MRTLLEHTPNYVEVAVVLLGALVIARAAIRHRKSLKADADAGLTGSASRLRGHTLVSIAMLLLLAGFVFMEFAYL